MRRVVILQARMTSTRLPGKILLDLGGKPMLAREIERIRLCRRVDALCLATTTNATDDPVADLAGREGCACFRGDEQDVLGRYLGAARATDADVIVRATGDCPLLDPEVLDRAIDELVDHACDYASNTIVRTYPRGLDVEAFHRDTLERIARLAMSQPAREHVTYFLHRERPELFLCRDVVDETDSSDLRWTVDTSEDLAMIRALFAAAGLADRPIAYRDLLAVARSHPEIVALNRHVEQKKT